MSVLVTTTTSADNGQAVTVPAMRPESVQRP
jgi:hypothetical protein